MGLCLITCPRRGARGRTHVVRATRGMSCTGHSRRQQHPTSQHDSKHSTRPLLILPGVMATVDHQLPLFYFIRSALTRVPRPRPLFVVVLFWGIARSPPCLSAAGNRTSYLWNRSTWATPSRGRSSRASKRTWGGGGGGGGFSVWRGTVFWDGVLQVALLFFLLFLAMGRWRLWLTRSRFSKP